jgi:HAD superfamily hydrolase (TIGR01509 family)
MIRVVLFDLGGTLIDALQRPFAHVPSVLTTIAGFRTADGKPVRSALVSDFTMVAPPLTSAKIKPVFEQYVSLLTATGLRSFFEPVNRRVTLSTHVGVFKPDRAVFEKALSRLQVKASLADCVFITESPAHVAAARQTLGMSALQFAAPGVPGADFNDWSWLPSLLLNLPGAPVGHA